MGINSFGGAPVFEECHVVGLVEVDWHPYHGDPGEKRFGIGKNFEKTIIYLDISTTLMAELTQKS